MSVGLINRVPMLQKLFGVMSGYNVMASLCKCDISLQIVHLFSFCSLSETLQFVNTEQITE